MCTFLPTVTEDITTGSSSCGTTSSRSELVKQRVASKGDQVSSYPRKSSLGVSFTFGGRASSSRKSSWNGVQLFMEWCLMCLVLDNNLSFWLFLVILEILLQEPFLHQASQLVTQGYASLDVVPKCFVELALGISPRSQVPIRLLGKL